MADILGGVPLMSDRDARMLSPQRLAYIGDAVHDLFVRTELVLSGAKEGDMHRSAVARVRAGAQAQALARIQPLLTEEEADVVRRGRNAHAHHGAPKRTNPAEYKQATGLEALLGYLYLTGRRERLATLYDAMWEEETCPEAR